MEIIRATREVSLDITIQKVSYYAIIKSLIIPTQELKIIKKEIMRVKRNGINYNSLTLEDKNNISLVMCMSRTHGTPQITTQYYVDSAEPP